MLCSDAGCVHALLATVNEAWNKFRELKSFLCAKRIGLNVKCKVYETCTRSCLIYGGEIWDTLVKNLSKSEMLWLDVCHRIARQTHECRLAEQIWH